ncbi:MULTISPECIES: hypothetical protein [unclassified Agarivorans]|uniref:hypothetical protein n=1 Tax=unclassified Agarivorans TaxID=2636026 RepID=UPI003D7EE7FD
MRLTAGLFCWCGFSARASIYQRASQQRHLYWSKASTQGMQAERSCAALQGLLLRGGVGRISQIDARLARSY